MCRGFRRTYGRAGADLPGGRRYVCRGKGLTGRSGKPDEPIRSDDGISRNGLAKVCDRVQDASPRRSPMARSSDFVARSTLPGGLIARQIPKWIDVPNDRCVGLIPPPQHQVRSGRLYGGHAQTLPSSRRRSRYKVPARWSLPLDVPHVFPGLPEKLIVHPDGLPDGRVGEIQYRSGVRRRRPSAYQGEVGPAGTRR